MKDREASMEGNRQVDRKTFWKRHGRKEREPFMEVQARGK